jgi:hypothetical protein
LSEQGTSPSFCNPKVPRDSRCTGDITGNLERYSPQLSSLEHWTGFWRERTISVDMVVEQAKSMEGGGGSKISPSLFQSFVRHYHFPSSLAVIVPSPVPKPLALTFLQLNRSAF